MSYRHNFVSQSPRYPLWFLVTSSRWTLRTHGTCFFRRRILLLVVQRSLCLHIHILHCENSEAFPCFQSAFQDVFRGMGNYIQKICSDGGSESTSKHFCEYLSQKGGRNEVTAPYSLKRYGFWERHSWMALETAHSLLHSSGYPLSFWAEACHTTIYTLNHRLSFDSK